MNNYKNITAKVLRIDEEEHKFVIEVEDRIYKVAQIDFQRRQPMPETLNCLMVTTHLGKVFIAQNIELLMRQYYKEDDEVDFKIKLTIGDCYHLEDQYGFTAILKRDTVINAALTPRVRCRITKIRQKQMEVQLVDVLGAEKSEFSLSDKDFCDIIGNESWNTPEFRKLMLGDTPSDIFDLECLRWINGISRSLNQDELQEQLQNIHARCLEALESESLLPRCKEAERILLEQRFTDIIELISYYIQAIEILRNGTAEDTISHILSTLSTCAYIYHPRKQFCIMQCIFMLDFSMMEKHIDTILATLRSQEVYLWNRKPFQMQWLKLLQGYVDNIYNQTDRLSSDLTTKETMIQVLIIELILGRNATHKIYDTSLNQAILYRLVSLMNVSDPNKTLQRAFLSLFTQAEFDAALPFNSDDAFVLSNMLCSQNNDTVESFEPAKYESDMALLSVNEQAITIQPKDLDRDNLYMPLSARMGLWHGLSIRLDEKPPVKLRGKVGTTIEHFKELWEYINHSLFSKKRKTSKKQNRKLYIDDETVIIVTKQLPAQYVFECKVVEDGC